MLPLLPRKCAHTVVGRKPLRTVLRAIATLGQAEQPALYSHIQPHGHATGKLARSFAAALGCRGDAHSSLDEIELGAHLHDFGKYLISKSILLKPGPLTEAERAVVAHHPAYGAQVLSGLPTVTDTTIQIVLYHHEHWDGSGYPEGLRGEQIPWAARLVAIVDVYTSLRARRPYKPPLTRYEAAATLKEMAGAELDPDMTQSFLRFIRAD